YTRSKMLRNAAAATGWTTHRALAWAGKLQAGFADLGCLRLDFEGFSGLVADHRAFGHQGADEQNGCGRIPRDEWQVAFVGEFRKQPARHEERDQRQSKRNSQ